MQRYSKCVKQSERWRRCAENMWDTRASVPRRTWGLMKVKSCSAGPTGPSVGPRVSSHCSLWSKCKPGLVVSSSSAIRTGGIVMDCQQRILMNMKRNDYAAHTRTRTDTAKRIWDPHTLSLPNILIRCRRRSCNLFTPVQKHAASCQYRQPLM